MSAANPIIVALDCNAAEALSLAQMLRGRVQWLKVGMTLYYAEGPEIVARLSEMGFSIFVDLKLHDIPHQVAGASAEIAKLGARHAHRPRLGRLGDDARCGRVIAPRCRGGRCRGSRRSGSDRAYEQ